MVVIGVVCIILAFTCISSGSVPGMDNTPYMLGAIVWAAIGSVLIAKGKAKKKEAKKTDVIVNSYTVPQRPQTPVSRPAARVSVITSAIFPVAGVTFDNDDGSSRQEILREICGGKEEGETEAWLEWYQYRGQDAYHVMTPFGCVGNIRRCDIQNAVVSIGASSVGLEVSFFETDDGREIYRADVIVDQ